MSHKALYHAPISSQDEPEKFPTYTLIVIMQKVWLGTRRAKSRCRDLNAGPCRVRKYERHALTTEPHRLSHHRNKAEFVEE